MSESTPTPLRTCDHPDAKWFVLHCLSRQEQCVADHVTARGASSFLPRMMQVRYYGKRKVRRQYPLFSGYVFMHGTREDVFSVDRSRGLVQIIEPVDQERLTWELTNLNLALEHEAPLMECAYLSVGTRVQVRSGPFKGMQGVVELGRTEGRLVLQVDMLGRAMSVEIDASLLDRVEDEMFALV